MANPRAGVEFERIDSVDVTFKVDNVTIVYDATKPQGAAATMIGMAVSLSADDTVQLCSDAEAVIGKLLRVEADNVGVVQTGGYCSFAGGNAATLTRGAKVVGALGAAAAKGYIRAAASATAAELLVARGQIIRNADTANVVVNLG
jgi:predicted homoserine dehydrogenase-like protein